MENIEYPKLQVKTPLAAFVTPPYLRILLDGIVEYLKDEYTCSYWTSFSGASDYEWYTMSCLEKRVTEQ